MATCDHCGFQSNVTKMFDHHMLSLHAEALKVESEKRKSSQINTDNKVKWDFDLECRNFESKPNFDEMFELKSEENKEGGNAANFNKSIHRMCLL